MKNKYVNEGVVPYKPTEESIGKKQARRQESLWKELGKGFRKKGIGKCISCGHAVCRCGTKTGKPLVEELR